MARRVHDIELLDAIEAIPPVRYEGSVWRVCPQGRDPTQGWKTQGRWSDGSFHVLHTSMQGDTAKAEVHYHLYRKNPVPPSKLRHELHELSVEARRTLKLLDTEALRSVGISEDAFYSSNFKAVTTHLFPKTQAIGAAAKFLDYDGLHVPSARAEGHNMILLTDNFDPAQTLTVRQSETIDLRHFFQEKP